MAQPEIIILDFETTGLNPTWDRTIEVAAVLLVNNRPADRFCKLMHPGSRVPSFITDLTGITNDMVRGQPRPEEVMPRLRTFVGRRPIVAHNASFDSRFLRAEMERAGLTVENDFICTMRLARRLVPGLPSYRLEALIRELRPDISSQARFHRAEADIDHTVGVWQRLYGEVQNRTGLANPPMDVLKTLMRTPVKKAGGYLERLAAG